MAEKVYVKDKNKLKRCIVSINGKMTKLADEIKSLS